MPIFALTSQSDSIVFAGDDMDGGVYRSTNLGYTWNRLAWGLANGQIQTLAINSEGDLFASAIGTPTRTCRMAYGGEDWQVQIMNEPVNEFCFDNNGRGFAASLRNIAATGGIFRSTDNGVSWARIVSSDFDIFSVACNSPLVFAGTANGFYRSTDSGETWEQPNSKY